MNYASTISLTFFVLFPISAEAQTSDLQNSTASTAAVQISPALEADLDKTLDALVWADAKNWVVNSYVRGSMHDARVLKRNGSNLTVYGEYIYNKNSRGWVKAHYTNGTLRCIEFSDFAGACRPLGSPPDIGPGVVILGIATAGEAQQDGRNQGRQHASGADADFAANDSGSRK